MQSDRMPVDEARAALEQVGYRVEYMDLVMYVRMSANSMPRRIFAVRADNGSVTVSARSVRALLPVAIDEG